jgi:hypothetical protein
MCIGNRGWMKGDLAADSVAIGQPDAEDFCGVTAPMQDHQGAERPDLMGFVGPVLGAGSTKVAAGGSALTGSDPLVEVWRQTVRPLVVRRRNHCWDDVPPVRVG